MAQLEVTDNLTKGIEGQLADSGKNDVASYGNFSLQTNRVEVVTPDNVETFTVTINGEAFDFVSDADGTIIEIGAGLVAAINLGAEPVSAVDNLDGTFQVISDTIGVSFTITVGATGAGVMTQDAIILNNQAIDFGLLVVQDPNNDQGAILPSLQSEILDNIRNILGIDIHSHTAENAREGEVNSGNKISKAMSVLRRGRVLVRVEEAVTPASVPHVRFEAGAGGTRLGAFRASVDTATAEPLGEEFRYKTSAGIGELAVLEISLP